MIAVIHPTSKRSAFVFRQSGVSNLIPCSVQGEDWEDGFASGLLNSLCFFPLLSYGATAPLAMSPQDNLHQAVSAGWDERPAGRARLCGSDSDAEDNMLKEFLIAVTLLRQAAVGDE